MVVKRKLNTKEQQALQNIALIRKKLPNQLTASDIKKIVIFMATKQGILK